MFEQRYPDTNGSLIMQPRSPFTSTRAPGRCCVPFAPLPANIGLCRYIANGWRNLLLNTHETPEYGIFASQSGHMLRLTAHTDRLAHATMLLLLQPILNNKHNRGSCIPTQGHPAALSVSSSCRLACVHPHTHWAPNHTGWTDTVRLMHPLRPGYNVCQRNQTHPLAGHTEYKVNLSR